ncbi:unnamed protein product [Prunus armeniaca]|uniref:Uncharacterized protein n=1 Tax=Prunus armeniaca TaxID=36596 RepID=A0A6J5VEQ1_PRUAR|nr:unnamed protein product [Prunus armeniaca]
MAKNPPRHAKIKATSSCQDQGHLVMPSSGPGRQGADLYLVIPSSLSGWPRTHLVMLRSWPGRQGANLYLNMPSSWSGWRRTHLAMPRS